jgi:hypothetical protein
VETPLNKKKLFGRLDDPDAKSLRFLLHNLDIRRQTQLDGHLMLAGRQPL